VERRILLLVTDLQIGGTPTVVRELAVRLAGEKAVRVHVACLAGWGPVAGQIRERGVEVTALGKGSKRDAGIFFRLVDLIRRGRFDTVLSFLVHANALAAGASLICPGVRFVQSIQTTQPRPRWHWGVQRLVQGRADVIVVHSPSVAKAAAEWAGVAARKIVVIPNAVEMEDFAEIRREKEVRSERGRRSGRRVGFIGRLDPIKRLGDLVAAMAMVGADVSLDIYGEGVERAAIEAQINRLGLRGRVVLHGAASGPNEALAGMDVLVLPSEAEGFGLVLIEAMAAGVAVVATDVPGIRDVVRDGVNGLLAPVGNPAGLAAAIGRVLGDDELRKRLVEGGVESVRGGFAWGKVWAMWRRVFWGGEVAAEAATPVGWWV
jgi:glycosyltransferase involved in cell wall biosynthesis